MLKAPICPVCGKSAWPSQQWLHKECGIVVLTVANKPEGVVANAAEVTHPVANRHGKYADTEKRKAYMRDLMRKRRANAKP